ncbi:hypothetical protein LSCM1_02998 [Leishmania martiniquensis]|uniref:Uncharacterized protein n=1 Tax=Leishmania martiniquensis TaxID=1580590 RepID=A0A836H7R4_9TRYP|nr:hypothetical protein LSCM1_02998 [Leishmania martiniquensis]
MRAALSISSYLRSFAGRAQVPSARMTWHSPLHQESLSLTCSSTLCSLRLASSRVSRISVSTPPARRKNKRSPTVTSTRNSRRTTAKASSSNEGSAAALDAAEEHQLTENDVRLAMRTVMASHFSLVQHARIPEMTQVAKEREAIEEKHQGRQQRLLEKDENSLRLLGADGMVIGEGILPLLAASKKNPYDWTSSHRATPSPDNGAWRALNPVGLAASQAVASASFPGNDGGDADALSEDDYASFLASTDTASTVSTKEGEAEMDAWKSATLATLSEPDLSVYDPDHDFRISSEEAIQRGMGDSAKAAASTSNRAGAVGAQRLEVPADLGAVPAHPVAPKAAAAAMQLRLDEDEDSDYTVAAFTDDREDPLDL